MFSHLKISAILIGLFTHVIISFVIFFVSAFIVSFMNASPNKSLYALAFILVLIAARGAELLATGYLIGYVAKTQPLLHAFVCGCIAVLFQAVMDINPLLSIFVYIPGLVAGAWIYRKRTNE